MTRLSLHHDDENPNLSIHLREGQYCTVGSSAAADYSFRAEGVEPVHCRIGCQSSGGYIECFDVFDSITINDIAKGRSRLSNGDTLRIGTVELRVELPEMENKLANFAVEFESEETPTTKVVGAYELEKQTIENQSADDQSCVPGDSDVSERGISSQQDKKLNPADVSPQQPQETEIATESKILSKPESDIPQPLPAKIKSDESKPQFQFDSAEPVDMEITHAEFEELANTDADQVTLGAVDLESALVKAETTGTTGSVNFDLQAADESKDEDEGEVFRGGAFVGKYWRWNGEQAIAVLQQLMDSPEKNRIYRSNVNQLTVDSFEDISLVQLTKQQPAVFLVSSMDLSDLQQLVRQKRWTDRIGHPQAVVMFLTFLPKRILGEFFEAINACVLVHENDVELIRIRKSN